MKTKNLDLLSDEFEGCSYDQWKVAAEKLLKGAPFDKKMRTRTPEGITLEPIYFPDCLDALPQSDSMPGDKQFLRGVDSVGYLNEGWAIAQETTNGFATDFNEALLSGLENGQTALNAVLDDATRMSFDPIDADIGNVAVTGLSLSCSDDFAVALEGVFADAIPLNFQSGISGVVIESMLLNWLSDKKVALTDVRCSVNMDPLATLAEKGFLPSSLSQIYGEMALLAKFNNAQAPGVKAIGVSGIPYHSAGASAVEELAVVLATGLQYVRELCDRGLSVDEVAEQIRFTFALGGDFFMEVSKIRAARILWSRIVKELGGGLEAQKMRIHARTGTYNKTVYDPYVNMLRTTTEALSGIVGGVESLSVGVFDEVVRDSDEFSRRIARNTQVILQEECELTHVIDAGGGSWYIESLTEEIAKRSWSIFQEIEREGGPEKALKNGYIQGVIRKTRESREALLGKRISSLVGTNQYPNLHEKGLGKNKVDSVIVRKQRIDALYGKLGSCTSVVENRNGDGLVDAVRFALRDGATIGKIYRQLRGNAGAKSEVEALPVRRLASCYEELRIAADNYRGKNSHGPKVYLLNIGSLKRHKARADFSRNFFEAGGFEVISSSGFDEEVSAVEGLKESGAELVVICGRDDDYAERLPAMLKAVKEGIPDMTTILAGFPGDNEDVYRAAGLDDYIFIKSNNYETNLKYLKKLGVINK
ncbi:acyl-CoA mutase large subunit family protein [Puniceicoccaceae bacterium K14]|nr:acyl-CoA mutase large subunit family protein [Puniceicoccaceae bacterium K14]